MVQSRGSLAPSDDRPLRSGFGSYHIAREIGINTWQLQTNQEDGDEALAALLETSGATLLELVLNNIEKENREATDVGRLWGKGTGGGGGGSNRWGRRPTSGSTVEASGCK
ncbi:hypothetical protein KSP40_PGU004693 [Platanthera guangdongensis]|uniref:Uncharacterized protein n=1 Tax=Platanthera guangdongensis TaxID=2320717 RepID=A0ABR2LIQ2_9ASPA